MPNKDPSLELAEERTELAYDRNRLSNQRTFLSWFRTGLTCAGGGIAVMRVLNFEDPTDRLISQSAGIALILLGVLIFALAFFDYTVTYRQLKEKNAKAGIIWPIAILCIGAIIVALVMLEILVSSLHTLRNLGLTTDL